MYFFKYIYINIFAHIYIYSAHTDPQVPCLGLRSSSVSTSAPCWPCLSASCAVCAVRGWPGDYTSETGRWVGKNMFVLHSNDWVNEMKMTWNEMNEMEWNGMEWNDSMVDWLNEWMHDCMNEWLNEWMMIYCNDRNWGMMGIKNLNRSVETHLTISISTIDVFHQGLSNLYSWHTFDAQRLWVVSGMVFPEVCVQEWKDDSRWLCSAPIHFRW